MSTIVPSGRSGGCFVVGATSPREVTPAQVGVKAFNLMMMSEAGLSIPPAFVLGTQSCQEVEAAGGRLGDPLVEDVLEGIGEIERRTGRRFGAGRRPLLVSVRSGAAVSMPGMLETVLNVGLSDTTLPGLLRSTGNPTFVWDSYRRLIQAYAEVVEGCPAAPFAGAHRCDGPTWSARRRRARCRRVARGGPGRTGRVQIGRRSTVSSRAGRTTSPNRRRCLPFVEQPQGGELP